MLKLHLFPPSPRAFKTLLAAHHLGIEYELRLVNLTTGAHKTPEFSELNVNQRMPVLEEDGYVLWESNAIVEYLASKNPAAGLMPEAVRPRLQIAKWLYWESAHWDQAAAIFMFENVVKAIFQLGEPSASEIARGTTLMHRLAGVLDGELQRHRYVAGDTLTAADIAIVAPLCYAEQAQMPLETYGAIQRWFAQMKALPAWTEATALQRMPG
jgi:glutathione S-transferase